MSKTILDAACGGRQMWFNKKHPKALYVDNRRLREEKLANGQYFSVKPDVVMDFRKLDIPTSTFSLVVFDPPHIVSPGTKSYMIKKYGGLRPETWRADLRKGFEECWRVLRPNGVLIFKWNEVKIPLKEVLAIFPEQPLFGHRTSIKTHWLCFMKLKK